NLVPVFVSGGGCDPVRLSFDGRTATPLAASRAGVLHAGDFSAARLFQCRFLSSFFCSRSFPIPAKPRGDRPPVGGRRDCDRTLAVMVTNNQLSGVHRLDG